MMMSVAPPAVNLADADSLFYEPRDKVTTSMAKADEHDVR